jgi:DNA-binding winged helix-turn-helix (wHTH) protein
LLPQRRELLANGVAVELGARAFDVLALLVEARGALVTKDEIMAGVWPDTVVEENNLAVQISALRKALGADRGLIRTVPGRGTRSSQKSEAQPPTLRGSQVASTQTQARPPRRPMFRWRCQA